ncbi:hypothetical protein [Rhodopirellula sp. P2]|uniref:hypothetical protein n=1 Tax=Rhodopirellula sp. P2 TaxID=2127060 RepID=UPI002368A82C|nr:hypothetical protein [Rhodopirellula sp. P2]WDQ18823.1 hypothetical protein PSR62_09825 [Rhodopirellula sp. P2]
MTRSAKLKDSTEPEVLYDLQNDPTESRDVSDKYPDVAGKMSRELKQWCDSVERDRVRPKAMPADAE